MRQKILLVDDEPLNLDLLEQELGELGYAIE
jgi:CheY-like chemotaxis protein